MRQRSKPERRVWAGLALLVLAALLPSGVHWFFFGGWDLALLLFPPQFFLAVTLVYHFLDLTPTPSGAWSLQLTAGLLLLVIFGAGGLYFLLHTTWAAWLVVVGVYVLSLAISRVMLTGLHGVRKAAILLLLAVFQGVVLVGAAELEGRFSNEEFYSGAEAVVLAVQWLLVALAQERLEVPVPAFRSVLVPVQRQTLAVVLILAGILGLPTLVSQYQHSFYTVDVPQYQDISEQSPFLCGNAPPGTQKVSAVENARLLAELVSKNPNKGAPEYGLLALLDNDPQSAQQFKVALLKEAAAGNYTGPAGSVKYGQYQAALRIYYYIRVRQAFSGLFAPTEAEALQEWFAAINRRALTVEPVDWMYALAFSKNPQGPYANQDIGPGLLALLESSQLSDPALSDRNRAYLEAEPRGWASAFRNTDDSIAYQQAWDANAWLQSRYNPAFSSENRRMAFDWLLRLALPDGSLFNINPYSGFSMASAAHLGASLLEEPDLLWLEGRALEWLVTHGGSETASIGDDLPVQGDAPTPGIGSCLLYGSSGLPDQPGPLAPDKIVLRDGWEDDSQYVLLNLRFTGWHRYKATNSISLIYRNAPLAMETTAGREYGWLPIGRQQFRDKRIPRENLNSLSVPVQGFQSVDRLLAGLRSRWAQDPPYYATVSRFETGPAGDTSVTRIRGWHGWDYIRTIQLFPRGPILIHDRATGPQSQQASLFWHLIDAQVDGDRARLGANGQAGEVVFIPISAAKVQVEAPVTMGVFRLTPVELSSSVGGQLDLVTVFLTGEWVGAHVAYHPAEGSLVIQQENHTLTVPLK